ncbi:hypothetical protein P170DRAFT_458846 [Aspergillus steynii IBT 23096]|uniref:DUF2264 domain-containing protein n=1 Tax=Aspergillus steynii IBT 23096 TaxID=1392250 RepID=A0A2I2FU33_9EURO|nr:uncharacterized protein P170DRAFT_458846 [Aspergillus steynii IBT 23096]PLB44153.1 hypothetical protein P170DRAFT_458846 [Aspergillus steynii IBT 23096]
MPPLPGFSDNPFRSRSDLVRAATSIVSALEPYKSKGKARIKLPIATAAGFDDVAAQLEGFARPLWVVPLMLNESIGNNAHLNTWIEGLETGTDPDSPEYWGDLTDFDQRMVEMESIAFALLCNGDTFLGPLSAQAKTNLATWLGQINQHRMPQNNWLWFRIFVNLALVKALGIERDEVQEQMDADFETLESFQIGEGWSSDGLWGDERKQADYYSGSFAIHFAQLLYVRFVGDEDKTRVDEYRRHAKEFGKVFWRYFDLNGAAIPFGRSMTYRFAFAAFWSAMACADVQLPAPFDNIGIVKGMLFRHLRWWAKRPEIFNVDGTMNIGFTYPNMYMSEAYNSPQSVYWCLKSFIVLMLPEDHGFWAAPELPHPLAHSSVPSTLQPLAPIKISWPPRHILCNTPEHHFLLSSGQMSRRAHKAREAKYGKFAYSSAFGFSVPAGPLLEQLAPDSTLCASHDDGESWNMRAEPLGERLMDVKIAHDTKDDQKIQALASDWRPWKYLDLTITTVLIPPAQAFPGWHIRVHRVTYQDVPWVSDIQIIDSGFALDAETPSGGFITPEVQSASATDAGSCLLSSSAGTSAIADMKAEAQFPTELTEEEIQSESFALRADPNTNLMSSRTLIPSIKHRLSFPGRANGLGLNGRQEALLVSGIFAVAASAGTSQDTIRKMWSRRPRLHIDGRGDMQISVL